MIRKSLNNKVKVIVSRTAGTNCDFETVYAFELAGAKAERVHINMLIKGEKKLADYDILAIPGGFSYGDDIAAGKILANELRYKLYDQIVEFAANKKPIIGICNGFQVLVKTGLLPGMNGLMTDQLQVQTATLTYNDSGKFECRWIKLKRVESNCIWTKDLKGIISLPVAHGEGKLVFENEKYQDEVIKNKQIVFQYVDENGNLAGYPYNPNGSVLNIAGICNPEGNILGMMPHPERYLTKYNHPHWTRLDLSKEGDGLQIFRNAVDYVIEKKGNN